jgi:hypothetical protein
MKIEILSEEKVRVGTVNFGSCVVLDNKYYILSDHTQNTNNVNLIDLSTGSQRIVSIDTQIHIIDNAKIVIQ